MLCSYVQNFTMDRFLLIFVLVVAVSLILGSVNSELFSSGESPSNGKSVNISRHPVLIVISYDGFRFNYFDRTETPNLDYLKSKGSSVLYMKNQFVTKTFPNHMSIATGLYLESHGVVDNNFFDPDLNKSMDPHLDQFWNFDNVTLPLWTLNELAGDGRKSGTMMWPGSNFPFGSQMIMPSKYVPWNESMPFEIRIDTVMEWITDDKEPVNLVFMYFEEPDEVAHAFGPESQNVTDFIQRLDNTTGYLIEKLKANNIFDKVNIIMLSDHGFHELKQKDIINVTTVGDPSLYKVYGSTPVLHILPNEGKKDEVHDAFKRRSSGLNFSVYTKEDMPSVWHYTNNRRIMPIVLVADLGFGFDDFYETIDSYNKKYNITPSPERVYGVHGYDNRNLPMHPFFLSHGPLFKSGLIADPFENIDLFPLICEIMKIPPVPNNGTIDTVQSILRRQQGYGAVSSLGWAIGAGVIFGVLILLGIMSLLVSSRKIRKDEKLSLNSEKGYKYIHRRAPSSGDPVSDKNLSSPTFVQVNPPGSQEEYQALLMSSSNEELS